MEEGRFRRFLRSEKLSENTIRSYTIHVKKFEWYLWEFKKGKRLEDANKVDIEDFVSWGRNELDSINPYLAALQKYYQLTNKDLYGVVRRVFRDKPETKPERMMTWNRFEESMDNIEKKEIGDRDRALLNLLWSEMQPKDMIILNVSDIDFKARRITGRQDKGTYYLTPRAWSVLERYIPVQERGKNKPLFPTHKGILSYRSLQKITRKYFEDRSDTPTKFKHNCEEDLREVGRKTRFVVSSENAEAKLEMEVAKTRELCPTKFLEKLPTEVRKIVQGVLLNYQYNLPEFCFSGMRKALIDGINIRFREGKKAKILYDKNGNPYPLSRWIDLAKQEGYISSNMAKNLKREVKVFGDTASHDYRVDFHKDEVLPIFKHLRLALNRMYYNKHTRGSDPNPK